MNDDSIRTEPVSVEFWRFLDDGAIPNNVALPLLVYRQAAILPERDPACRFESVFTANGWPAAWRYGIFPFHHYHSTAHEALGVYSGSATVLFGGEFGAEVRVRAGDAIIIPAGVGHKALEASRDLGVVGAYPAGTEPDLLRGDPEDRPRSLESIAQVALPDQDPVYGTGGPLMRRWTPQAASLFANRPKG